MPLGLLAPFVALSVSTAFALKKIPTSTPFPNHAVLQHKHNQSGTMKNTYLKLQISYRPHEFRSSYSGIINILWDNKCNASIKHCTLQNYTFDPSLPVWKMHSQSRWDRQQGAVATSFLARHDQGSVHVMCRQCMQEGQKWMQPNWIQTHSGKAMFSSAPPFLSLWKPGIAQTSNH
jgi:hypothetical protein